MRLNNLNGAPHLFKDENANRFHAKRFGKFRKDQNAQRLMGGAFRKLHSKKQKAEKVFYLN